jgi:phospholipid/cholesterol/gamma-HCH transport system ATP-binding protein
LILDTHREFGYTAILVSHEIPEVFDIATHVAMIYEGRIIEEGTPEKILKSSDPLIRQFIEGNLEGPIRPL